ncbi:GGDEF domain-containing protein [Mameliella sp. CS4]|uniref:GGDEF domain-containing protein n=1 Tax=Mameliella sp. CS4 TaxID=2862329 RepID=UPI001C5E8FCF|nr:GGDEF domain-containing protein [Mameliella sp. CS4]MBW4981184.1 GGDEF domain-containing protein [Mameliella sp. CS4]
MTGSDAALDVALTVIGQAVERAPRAMMLLDDQWNVLLANRHARGLPGLEIGMQLASLAREDAETLQKGLKQAISTSRGIPLRLTFAEDPMTFQAWRIDPLPGTDTALVMLQSDPSNLFAARLTSLERKQDSTRRRLNQTEEERDRLRHTARRLSSLAMTDPLTGLMNARSFRQKGQFLLDNPQGTVGLIYIDLNGFKPINDQYGHSVGDEVLSRVARRLRETLPKGVGAARLGGDEFGIWRPDTDQRALLACVNELRAALARPMTLERSGAADIVLPRIDAAFGRATAPRDGNDVDMLLKKADARMYADKSRHSGACLRLSG